MPRHHARHGLVRARRRRRRPAVTNSALAARGGDLFAHRPRVVAARGRDDGGALPGERQRDRPADAARRAGDQRHALREVHHMQRVLVSPARRPASSAFSSPCAVLDAHHRHRRIDLPDQAREHRARPQLHERPRAVGDQPAHDVLPAHRRRHLTNQRLDGARRRRSSAARRRWRRPETPDRSRVERAQLRRQPLLRRRHQRAMERRADRQRNHPLGAARLRQLAGARHRAPHARQSPPALAR